MRQKLCAIGEALIDFIPQKKGQRLKDVTSFTRVAGGAPANVAGAVAKLGLPSKFVTKLSHDAFGEHILECFQSCGIDTSSIQRTKSANTGLAFVSLAADGNRDFLFYRTQCADQLLKPTEICEDTLKDCGILHFCSVALLESPMKYAHKKLIQQAHAQEVLVSFDPNLRFSLWDDKQAYYDTIQEFLPLADIIKISDEEVEFITHTNAIEDALPMLFKGRVQLVLYTMGKDGAMAFKRHGTSLRVNGCKVEVMDTTGAGDAFIGAFLYQLLLHEQDDLCALSIAQLKDYIAFANGYAAYTTTKAGALDAMADMSQYRAFMKQMLK